ncbi:MAG: hypothetical protein LBB75_01430 [Oscillospiraceae bacterium]|jgi:hypothetical protein|nr:hypothetical protein [Oscillospiraceae bacterium]
MADSTDILGGVVSFARERFAKGSAKYGQKHPAKAIPRAAYDKLGEPASDHFTLGFAKADIMPDDLPKKKYWVAGYRINNAATGVLDPMTCSAVWIDDNTGRGGVFLVSVDSVGMSSYDSDLIVESMRAELEMIHCRGVFIMSCHNHAGIDTLGYWGPLPLTGRDPKYMDIVHGGIKKVMRGAYRTRRDGDLFHGTIEAPDVLRDSRPPQVWNRTLTRLRFAPADGSKETWLLNLGTHAESMLGANSLISADFPCYLRRRVAKKNGAEVIWFTGCEGGLIRPKELDENNIVSTVMCGEMLADAAMAITGDRKLPPLLNFLRQAYLCEAENVMLLMAVKLGIIKTGKKVAGGTGATGYCIETEMTYMNLGGSLQEGGLEMLFLPCELFPELAYGGYLAAGESATGLGPEANPKPLCEIAGNPGLLVFNLCNDMTGYVVPPNDWVLNEKTPYVNGGKDSAGRNHYEETNSLGPRTAEIIAGTFQGMMETVRGA